MRLNCTPEEIATACVAAIITPGKAIALGGGTITFTAGIAALATVEDVDDLHLLSARDGAFRRACEDAAAQSRFRGQDGKVNLAAIFDAENKAAGLVI
jgi:hypothetical protein